MFDELFDKSNFYVIVGEFVFYDMNIVLYWCDFEEMVKLVILIVIIILNLFICIILR